MKRIGLLALKGLLVLVPVGVAMAQPSRYEECREEAQQISGYKGEETQSLLKGAVRGGLGGAALGAAGGWITDSKASKTAKRGAALGALIGGVRAASKNKDVEEKRETYERALDRCLSRSSD
jgi:hypothetical protein